MPATAHTEQMTAASLADIIASTPTGGQAEKIRGAEAPSTPNINSIARSNSNAIGGIDVYEPEGENID